MLKSNMTVRAGASDKMMTNIDVLCASVLDVVFDVIEGGLGVSFDENRSIGIEFERAK